MRERREGMPVGLAVLLLVGAVVLNLGIGAAVHRAVQMGTFHERLPTHGGVMDVALVPTDPDAVQEDAPELPQLDGRLVENHRIVDERAPRETDKISEFDNTVENETKAPNVRPEEGSAPTRPGDSEDGQQGRQQSEEESQLDGPKKAMDGPHDGTEGTADDDVPLHEAADGSLSAKPGGGGTPLKPGLVGSPSQLRQMFGTPGTHDALEDVDEGTENLLNTRRHKFASFFNRVRDSVAQNWRPDVVHAARDPSGSIHGIKTRTTRLMIRLRPDGGVNRIVVDTPSGVAYLDEEAIRAVRTAGPFTNPPPGLVDSSTGFIDFGFLFIFELSGGKSKIFRYSL